MLKIKDEVDLKELEKFGYDEYDGNYVKTQTEDIHENNIDKRNRIIFVYTETSKRYAEEYEVQDLIQAGIVEKVSDR